MVKAAYSSGKPALGVGAGNTPAIIDDSADVQLAVNTIIHSKTFDNGMICASEQSAIVLDKIYDQVKKEFAARGCYFLKKRRAEQGAQDHPHQRRPERQDRGPEGRTPSPSWPACTVPEETKILIGEVDQRGSERGVRP